MNHTKKVILKTTIMYNGHFTMASSNTIQYSCERILNKGHIWFARGWKRDKYFKNCFGVDVGMAEKQFSRFYQFLQLVSRVKRVIKLFIDSTVGGVCLVCLKYCRQDFSLYEVAGGILNNPIVAIAIHVISVPRLGIQCLSSFPVATS